MLDLSLCPPPPDPRQGSRLQLWGLRLVLCNLRSFQQFSLSLEMEPCWVPCVRLLLPALRGHRHMHVLPIRAAVVLGIDLCKSLYPCQSSGLKGQRHRYLNIDLKWVLHHLYAAGSAVSPVGRMAPSAFRLCSASSQKKAEISRASSCAAAPELA